MQKTTIADTDKTFFATQRKKYTCLFFNSITNLILDTRAIG